MMCFADSLTKILEKKEEERHRNHQQSVIAWAAFEALALGKVEADFKERCTEAAENDESETAIDIEVLLRVVLPGLAGLARFEYTDEGAALPNGTWWYVTRGKDFRGDLNAPVTRREVVDYLIGKFMERLGGFGFQEVRRNCDDVFVSWRKPSEPATKRARAGGGNLVLDCCICSDKRTHVAAVPCGHLSCEECHDRARSSSGICAFCKQPITGTQAIFKP